MDTFAKILILSLETYVELDLETFLNNFFKVHRKWFYEHLDINELKFVAAKRKKIIKKAKKNGFASGSGKRGR